MVNSFVLIERSSRKSLSYEENEPNYKRIIYHKGSRFYGDAEDEDDDDSVDDDRL